LKQSTYANLLDLPIENDSLSLESKINQIQNEHNTMIEGYTLLKSIETLQNELKIINTDDDNKILNELIEQYNEQLKSCDSSFVEIISMIRQIQININTFNDSCQEIEHTIEQQRILFKQFIDNNYNILPDNLNQQIQRLKNLQREIETKTNSMIETLKETPINETKIEYLINNNEQLKLTILVSFKLNKK
ncbi:unnamed protein product, partial [Rotaria sordida]